MRLDGSTLDLPTGDRAAAPGGEPAPGGMIGRFVVRARLGAGGMGVVYAADDPDLGRAVALKLVREDVDGPILRARLLREAQAMGQLDHPHVVRVHEVGSAGERLFIAMELIDGVTLSRWVSAAPRGWRDVLAVFRQAGEGLAAVHAAGLVHRDFKPDNVLVDRDGRARVADFGLVRDPHDPSRPALTRTGAMMGTPGFMAPEQQLGGDVDARADQYAFCVALREGLRAARPAAPGAVRAVINRGLAYDPGERFASMDALLAALGRAARAPVRRAAIGAGLITALASGAAVVLALVAGGEPPRAAVAMIDVDAAPPEVIAIDAAVALAAPVDAPPIPVDAPARAPTKPKPAASPPPEPADKKEVTLLPPVPFVRGPDDPPPPAPPPKPVRHPIDKAHLPAVRAAIRDLGYRNLTLASIDADLAGHEQAARDARARLVADGVDDERLGIADVVLGQLRRRAGDCRGAVTLFRAAAIELGAQLNAQGARFEAYTWWGRAHFGIGLCRLQAGDLPAAKESLDQAIRIIRGKVEVAEVQCARAIDTFEGGDPERAKVLIRWAGRDGDDAVRAAMEPWMDAVGAKIW